MSDATTEEVVFALHQLNVAASEKTLHRIDWALGEDAISWSKERLREQLKEFVSNRIRGINSSTRNLSLHDFLCDRGFSIINYTQFVRSLNMLPANPTALLTKETLENTDIDSVEITFGQTHPDIISILNKLQNLGLTELECRIILGLGLKSFERLKRKIKDQKKEDTNRSGRSEEAAWSFAKHVVNDVCLRLFKENKNSSVFVLETHQGVGDASFLYQKHGNVLGFERDKDTHKVLLQRVQSSSFYQNARDFYLQKPDIFSSKSATNSNIFVTEEPTDSLGSNGLQLLVKQKLNFDVIDVDPFGSSQNFFSEVIKILSNSGLLMLTVGDLHPWPKAENQAWERFDVPDFNKLLSVEARKEWRQDWLFLRIASAWYMRAASDSYICLLPILIMRNLEPWKSKSEFANGATGVDRVYFVAKYLDDKDKIKDVFEVWTEAISIFDNPILRTQIMSPGKPTGSVIYLSFSEDVWPAMKPYWSQYTSRLDKTREKQVERWNSFEDARRQLAISIEQACLSKIQSGFELANNWLMSL